MIENHIENWTQIKIYLRYVDILCVDVINYRDIYDCFLRADLKCLISLALEIVKRLDCFFKVLIIFVSYIWQYLQILF